MRCRTSFFNGAIYRSCLKRYWPVWASLSLLWVLLLPLPILNMSGNFFTVRADDWLAAVGGYGGVVISFSFALVAAMAVYSWLYNVRSTGFTAALPVKREAMFLSCWAAGYTMLAVPGVLTALLCLLAGMGSRGIGTAVLVWLGQYLLMSLLFFGFASLCALLTGTMWVLPAVYAVLNVAATVLWLFLSAILEEMLYGFTTDGLPALAADLSPIVKLFTIEWDIAVFEDWLPLLCYGAFGIVASLLALLLMKKRRMECATDVVSVNFLKPVFRWCAAISAALGLGMVLYLIFCSGGKSAVAMGVFLLIGGFIGWFAAEMLVRKSYRVASCLKTFPIFAALVIVFTVSCTRGFFGYETRIPAADSIRSVVVNYRGIAFSISDPADIQFLREVHQEIVDCRDEDNGGYCWVELDYRLSSGIHMTRSYFSRAMSEASIQKIEGMASRAEQRELRELLNGKQWGYTYGCYHDDGLEVDGNLDLSERESRALVRDYLLPALERGELRSTWQSRDDVPWDDAQYFSLTLSFSGVPFDGQYTYRYYEYYITPKSAELFNEMKRLLETQAEWQDQPAEVEDGMW